MPRKRDEPENPDPLAPNFALGDKVEILRPNLWSGASGEVVTVYNTGLHRVRITGRNGEVFHADVWAAHLKLKQVDELEGLLS